MSENNIQTISVHELQEHWEQNPDICVIDVREPHEREDVHIPGTIHIPKDTITDKIENTVSDRDCPIYLHCRGGVRSLYAANCLLEMGYRNVYSVDGGIAEWEAEGYKVKRS